MYYVNKEEPVRSVRLDPELQERIGRAARQRGVSVSGFIREAVRREADSELGQPVSPDEAEDWRSWMKGPYAEHWIEVFEKIGFVDGSDDHLDDWARSIRDRNFRD